MIYGIIYNVNKLLKMQGIKFIPLLYFLKPNFLKFRAPKTDDSNLNLKRDKFYKSLYYDYFNQNY